MAIAVGDDDVARLAHRLVDHLVGRGRAVGHEIDVVRSDGARELLLRNLDVAGRLEHAVQAAGGGGALREKQVLPVELAHVADPVRLHDRLAARDRQRVEGADRPRGVLLQVVEMRRGHAVADTLEDVQMHLGQLLDFVEHASDHRGRRVARHLLDLPVGQQIEVELGADALDRPCQRHADLLWRKARRIELVVGGEEVAHQRHVVLRRHRNSVIDDHGFDLAVHDGGHDRVFEAAHQHGLVDHRVFDAAQAADVLRDPGKVGGLCRRDEQRLEVRPVRPATAVERQPIRHVATLLVAALPFAGVVAIATRQQRAADASRQSPDPECVVATDALGQ